MAIELTGFDQNGLYIGFARKIDTGWWETVRAGATAAERAAGKLRSTRRHVIAWLGRIGATEIEDSSAEETGLQMAG